MAAIGRREGNINLARSEMLWRGKGLQCKREKRGKQIVKRRKTDASVKKTREGEGSIRWLWQARVTMTACDDS